MAVNNAVVVLAVTTVFFAICSCGLAGMLLWMTYFAESGNQGGGAVNATVDVSTTTNFTEEIKQTFPGYFRTVEEQRAYEKLEYSNFSVVLVTNTSYVYRWNFTKCDSQANGTKPGFFSNTSGPPDHRYQRAVSQSAPCALDRIAGKELTYHCCCVSHSTTIAPETLPTPGRNSRQVQVAQFPNMRQYFIVQKCCQAKDCKGCQCSRTYTAVSAVLKTPNGKFKVGLVSIPACCKCLNVDN